MIDAFLDTAYAIALVAPGDLYHLRAREIATQLIASSDRLFTTSAVLLEVGDGGMTSPEFSI